MKSKFAVVGLCLMLLGVLVVPAAWADSGDQEMIVTVKNGPIEVPGRVLSPGKYDMKFIDQEREVVLLTSANGKTPVGFFEVIPMDREHPTSHVKLELSEAGNRAPERLTSFFYPGATTGYKFIYPKTQVMAMASVNEQAHS